MIPPHRAFLLRVIPLRGNVQPRLIGDGFCASQRVKECEAPENVETGPITGTGCLGHTLQYDQMRCRFRSGIPGNKLGYGCGGVRYVPTEQKPEVIALTLAVSATPSIAC
jgi:hypothetical protein